MTCNDSSKCSIDMITRLENALGIKLMARTDIEKINGYVSIYHKQRSHIITVGVYDQTENRHLKPSRMPTKTQIERNLI